MFSVFDVRSHPVKPPDWSPFPFVTSLEGEVEAKETSLQRRGGENSGEDHAFWGRPGGKGGGHRGCMVKD